MCIKCHGGCLVDVRGTKYLCNMELIGALIVWVVLLVIAFSAIWLVVFLYSVFTGATGTPEGHLDSSMSEGDFHSCLMAPQSFLFDTCIASPSHRPSVQLWCNTGLNIDVTRLYTFQNIHRKDLRIPLVFWINSPRTP